MSEEVRAGAALYTAGHLEAAETVWADGDDPLQSGLRALAATIMAGRQGAFSKAAGQAAEGAGSLRETAESVVDTEPLIEYLERIAADPEHVERVRIPTVHVAGSTVSLDDLDPAAAFIAAPPLAATLGFDGETVEDAVEYARTDFRRGDGDTRLLALIRDFLADPANRGTIFRRLESLVERRRTREQDVDGLF